MKKLLFILPLLYYSCTDDIVADIDALQTENAEQDAQIDSLMTALNEQQAYIDSLIGESSINDSLLQVYTDSLNTVQNAYIDSLHNAQQTTLIALANSALSAGFVETEVFSGAIPTSWTDVDLSSVVGQFQSLVILRYRIIDFGDSYIYLRPNGSDFEYSEYDGINSLHISLDNEFDRREGLALITTDSLGIIEHIQLDSPNNPTLLGSVVFYLNL